MIGHGPPHGQSGTPYLFSGYVAAAAVAVVIITDISYSVQLGGLIQILGSWQIAPIAIRHISMLTTMEPKPAPSHP